MSNSGDLIGPPLTAVGNPSKLFTSSAVTTLLYSTYNTVVGFTGSVGSGTLDVSRYTTKSVYAYIDGTGGAVTGSLVVSGSFDGTNYFQLKSGSFEHSGSPTWYTFTDAVPKIAARLYNVASGSQLSGSLFVVVQN